MAERVQDFSSLPVEFQNVLRLAQPTCNIIIRRVLDLPANDFYPDPADPINKPGRFLVDMAFARQARAEIEQRANGAVSQNRDHVYSLSNDDFLTVGDWAVIPCSGLPV